MLPLNFQSMDSIWSLPLHLAEDGHSIPDGLFVDILTEKCQLLHQHIKSSKGLSDVGCQYRS